MTIKSNRFYLPHQFQSLPLGGDGGGWGYRGTIGGL